ncbi:hypothetical protein NHQ30_001109 [Ciborinia camelliae]|nr:hypothetical protein NHQ30_001109 [Ciborinia camelliae]
MIPINQSFDVYRNENLSVEPTQKIETVQRSDGVHAGSGAGGVSEGGDLKYESTIDRATSKAASVGLLMKLHLVQDFQFESPVRIKVTVYTAMAISSTFKTHPKVDDVCVVAIHGFNGNENDTWTSDGDITSSALATKWFRDFDNPRICVYGYDIINNSANLLVRQGIRDEAIRLLDALSKLRNGSPKVRAGQEVYNGRSIVFVGHDLGGTLIKEALIIAASDGRFREIYHETRGLLFLSCPHQIDSVNSWSSFRRLFNQNKTLQFKLTDEFIKAVTNLVEDINLQFLDTELQYRVGMANVSSVNKKPEEAIFLEHETTMAIQDVVSRRKHMFTDDSHIDIARSPLPGPLDHLWDKLVDFARLHPFPIGISMLPHTNIIAPQVHKSSDATTMEDTIFQNSKFCEWKKAAGVSLLAIQCREDTETVSRALNSHLNESAGKRFIFGCKFTENTHQPDDLFSSLLFTGSILMEDDDIIKDTLKSISGKAMKLNIQDLFLLWHDILLSYDGKIYWVLQDFNSDIPGFDAFLDWINTLRTFSEPQFKVIIVTQSQIELQMIAPHFEVMTVGEGQKSPQSPEAPLTQKGQCAPRSQSPQSHTPEKPKRVSDILPPGNHCLIPYLDEEIAGLVLQHLHLYSCQSIINQWFSDCKSPAIRKATLCWLRILNSNLASVELQKLVSRHLCLTPEEMASKTLTEIMNSSKLKKLAFGIFELLLNSFRPLKASELSELLTKRSVFETSEIINSLTDVLAQSGILPGLLTVSNGQVHFTHPSFRQFTFSHIYHPSIDDLDVRTKALAHSRIAVMCVEYIRLVQDSELEKSGTAKEDPHIERRTDFLSYAIKYWPKHVELAGQTFSANMEPIKVLVGNEDWLKFWTKAYYDDCSKSMKEDQERSPLISSMSVFAEHGLEDMLAMIMTKYASQSLPQFPGECLQALELAARAGHVQIVHNLTERLGENATFDQAIIESINSHHMNIAIALIERVSNMRGKLVDATAALHRAIFMKMNGAVKLLIPLVTKDNHKVVQNTGLFEEVGKSGCIETLELLLDRKSGLYFMIEGEDPDMTQCLSTACKYGHHELVQHLLTGNFKLLVDGESVQENEIKLEADIIKIYRETMEIATKYGHHKILGDLLKTVENQEQYNKDFFVKLIRESVFRQRHKCFRLLNSVLSELNHKDKSKHEMGFDKVKMMKMAVENADETLLGEMLNLNWPLDANSLETLLSACIHGGDNWLHLAELLVHRGNKTIDHQGFEDVITKALVQAVGRNSEKLVQLLIQNKARLDSTCINSQTPLFVAALNQHVGIMRCLLEAKADPNTEMHDYGWTVLHAVYDSPEITKMLIEFNADINSKNIEGRTPLSMAVWHGNTETVKVLLEHKPEMDILVCGRTELSRALELQQDQANEIFNMLLDAGADPLHTALGLENTLLHTCVKLSKLEPLKRLLLLGLSVESVDDMGNTPLNCITELTEVPVIDPLVKLGASLLTTNKTNTTPLASAVKARNFEVAKYMLSKKSLNIDVPEDTSGAPIHIACFQCDLNMVKLLLEKGANVNETTETIFGTPFQAALLRETPDISIAGYILEHKRFKPNQTSSRWGCNLSLACLKANLDIIDKLLNLNPKVDVYDGMGRSPIHFALYRTIEHIERICSASNGDIDPLDAKDFMGRNALHFAVVSGRLDVVQYVLQRRKNFVNERDIDGWTPLLWAIRDCDHWDTRSDQKVKIIEELLRCGASILVKGEGIDRDWSPLRLANYYGLGDEVISLLTPSDKYINERAYKESRERWGDGEEDYSKKAMKMSSKFCDACLMDWMVQARGMEEGNVSQNGNEDSRAIADDGNNVVE